MSTQLNSFQLAKILREKLGEKLGEKEAESVVTYIEKEFESKKEILATRQDISDLKNRIDSHFKWLIGLFVGQMAFVLSIVYFILTYMKK